MSREEQIKNMARAIHLNCHKGLTSTEAEMIAKWCYQEIDRVSLKNAREIFEEIARYLRLNEDIAIKCKEENGEWNEEYWKGKLSAFKQIRGFIDAELKKKYTNNSEKQYG